MLEINNLHVEVENKEILSGIDLKIKAGEIVTTECVPVCGRLQGSQEDKIAALARSTAFYNK